MYKWYEHDEVNEIRCEVEERLNLPPAKKGEYEPAAAFWARVERAGLLPQALALYDQLAAERAAERVRRETKKEFEQRVEREGRQAEAEHLRAELLASGLSQRQVQQELVKRLQPLEGSDPGLDDARSLGSRPALPQEGRPGRRCWPRRSRTRMMTRTRTKRTTSTRFGGA